MLVTECAKPLMEWVQQQGGGGLANDRHVELLWGVRCLLEGLQFLHEKANLVHGNINASSVFIARNGDWKLSNLGLSVNPTVADDEGTLLASYSACVAIITFYVSLFISTLPLFLLSNTWRRRQQLASRET